jgi:hypothetical protein
MSDTNQETEKHMAKEISLNCHEKSKVMQLFFGVPSAHIFAITNDSEEVIGYGGGFFAGVGAEAMNSPMHHACVLWDSIHRCSVFDHPDSVICTFMDCLMEHGIFASYRKL